MLQYIQDNKQKMQNARTKEQQLVNQLQEKDVKYAENEPEMKKLHANGVQGKVKQERKDPYLQMLQRRSTRNQAMGAQKINVQYGVCECVFGINADSVLK